MWWVNAAMLLNSIIMIYTITICCLFLQPAALHQQLSSLLGMKLQVYTCSCLCCRLQGDRMRYSSRETGVRHRCAAVLHTRGNKPSRAVDRMTSTWRPDTRHRSHRRLYPSLFKLDCLNIVSTSYKCLQVWTISFFSEVSLQFAFLPNLAAFKNGKN